MQRCGQINKGIREILHVVIKAVKVGLCEGGYESGKQIVPASVCAAVNACNHPWHVCVSLYGLAMKCPACIKCHF